MFTISFFFFEMKNEAKGCPRAVLDRPTRPTLEIGRYLGKEVAKVEQTKKEIFHL